MYNAYVTKLKNVHKHSNADRLLCAECFGNGVIVGLDSNETDLILYFPSDGKLGIEYAEKNNLLRKKDPVTGENIGGYIDPDKRNISCIRLRGERSDGLVMPLSSLDGFTDYKKLVEGDKIDVLKGIVICEKYIPRTNVRTQGAPNSKKTKETRKDNFPFFEEHKDTSQLAYNLDAFKHGDTCYITCKCHGTSAREAYTIKETYQRSWLQRLLRRKVFPKRSWDHISGTRRVVLKAYDPSGYYNDNSFRLKYHEFFKTRLNKGETVYFEIVGWTGKKNIPNTFHELIGATIMGIANNKKTNDKNFIRQYGDTTTFSYGCEPGENRAFVYRMTMTNEDGYVVEYPTEVVARRCEEMGVEYVPIFDKFIFTTQEDLMERVEKYYDGPDPIGKTHVREGVVVRIDNKPTFTAFKHKNFSFKVLEGIVKADATEADMEEAQEIDIQG